LWGKPGEKPAPWLPVTFQLRGQVEHAATQRAGGGGIDVGQAVAGLAKPQRRARQTEAGLVWPNSLRASLRETVLTPLRQGRAPSVVFDDLELARSFRSGDWRCSLRGVATSRVDGPGYKALQMVGDITFASQAGLAWRGLADGKTEATAVGSRQRLRLEFGLDVAGLLARGRPGLAPEFLEASSLVRMGGHTDPGHRLTVVEDSQLRLVGGWRF
jgi:hypothetical protein